MYFLKCRSKYYFYFPNMAYTEYYLLLAKLDLSRKVRMLRIVIESVKVFFEMRKSIMKKKIVLK